MMQMFEWIYKLLYLNALWVLFTLAGLFVFGLFPSTTSMFYIKREWLSGDKDIPVLRTFITVYRSQFIRSNIMGAIVILVGILLYVDLQFFFHQEGIVFYILRYLMLAVTFVYVGMLPYLFPLFTYEKLSFKEFFKNVLVISITRIAHSVVMLIGCFTIFFIFSRFAGIFLLFYGSITAFWLSWNVNIALEKIHQKRVTYHNTMESKGR